MKKLIISLLLISFIVLSASEIEIDNLEKVFNNRKVAEEFLNAKPLKKEVKRKNFKNLEANMVIITTSQFESTFEEYVQLKKEEGINTFIATLNTIGDTFDQIRAYLRTEKQNNPDLKYVLIVGDETIVPTYQIPWFDDSPYEPYRPFSCDYGYSNVLHYWPESFSDNDDLMNIELGQDLIVGRLPIRTIEQAEIYLNKYNAYHHSMNEASSKWSFIANNFNRTTGDETSSFLIEQLIENTPNKVQSNFLRETDLVNPEPFDSSLTNEIQGSAEMFLNELNSNNHSFLFTIAHSNEGNYAVYDSEVDNSDEMYYKDGHSMVLTIDEDRANNGIHNEWTDYPAATYLYLPDVIPDEIDKPYIFFPISCESANLLSDDYDLCSAQSLFNQKGGPLLVYNSSCADNPTMTKMVFEYGLDYLIEDSIYDFGELVKLGWESIPDAYFNYVNTREMLISHHTFGDPSLKFYTDEIKNMLIRKEGNTYYTMDESGLEIENALITILDNGEIIAQGYSPFNYIPEKENLIVSANKANFYQYKDYIDEIEENTEIPYFTSFEEGLDTFWQSTISNENGRILISEDYSPYEGNKQLIMTGYGTQTSQFKVDLQNENRLFLNFWWKDFADANDEVDGVYFSNDNGTSFIKIYSFDCEGSVNQEWQYLSLNLDELTAGYEYTSNCYIQFRHSGFVDLPNDGIAFDNIEVTKAVAPLYFDTSFENGTLSNYWERESSNDNGEITITSDYSPYDGDNHIIFNMLENDIETINRLKLYSDFSNFDSEDLRLKFYWKDFSDDSNAEDGVFSSDNGGQSFTKVYDFDPSNNPDNIWSVVDLSIMFLSAENNLSLNEDFIIMIQQKDNEMIPNSGIAIDSFAVYEAENVDTEEVEIASNTLQNFPNPFKLEDSRESFISIKYSINEKLNNPKIEIFNLKGQLVKDFAINQNKNSIKWNCNNVKNKKVTSGIYFIVLKNNQKIIKLNKTLILK